MRSRQALALPDDARHPQTPGPPERSGQPYTPAHPDDGQLGPPAERRDEVDRIVEAWRRERPDLHTMPLHVFSRVTRLARHLDLTRRKAFTEHGVEAWEFDVLSALRRAGEPYELTPGRLIAETLVSSGTMTNRIDRMQAHGLVVRAADPADRRVVQVRLTAEGRRRVDAAMSALLASEDELLGGLDDTERAVLRDSLRTVLLHFDEA
ncbi:MarR family winged helix-turn-helix transcriptional regulator [Georgenia sp. TF02-10]|uniref:MarR family winged helix-turn-helix transcriptional regulator n=1 Tax=Georgenia sp. TF02-10 TaxID=2917725 RepID=UPI001FA73C71|nr:MarR family winged helix-turn-helix transcriptional regulator [Georgenia sp. TF02-10]UNX55562.1 MarR family winged helix-turn-helix transcriptional regulator [Georgenia sp. TF02-10]